MCWSFSADCNLIGLISFQEHVKVKEQVNIVKKTDLKTLDFLSDGMVAVKEGEAETPVTIVTNTASGQFVMVPDIIDLPEKRCLGDIFTY